MGRVGVGAVVAEVMVVDSRLNAVRAEANQVTVERSAVEMDGQGRRSRYQRRQTRRSDGGMTRTMLRVLDLFLLLFFHHIQLLSIHPYLGLLLFSFSLRLLEKYRVVVSSSESITAAKCKRACDALVGCVHVRGAPWRFTDLDLPTSPSPATPPCSSHTSSLSPPPPRLIISPTRR